MTEGNSNKIDNSGISPEQSVNMQSALTATRDSMPWLFRNKFIRYAFKVALGLLACTALYSIYVFTRHADPAEVFIFSAARYSPDKPFSLLVLARDAKKELPLENQSIDLYIGLKDKELRKLPPVKTGKDGIALVSIPPCPAGEYQIKATLRDLSAVSNIEVKSVYKAMLTSDKPMYQPGQTIHLRSLTLNATDLHPAPENNVTFKIHDPNGNLVLDQTAKSSAYGIAAADFQLADQVNTGEYKITVSDGKRETEKSVEVKNYRLPNYKIALNTDKKFYAPGDTVTGTVDARYIWGTPLANAKITLTASVKISKVKEASSGHRCQRCQSKPSEIIDHQQILADVNGITDSAGQFKFKFEFPDILEGIDFNQDPAECKIIVNAVSPAEYKQELNKTLMITDRPLHISYIPEFGKLLSNFSDRIYLFVSDPYGDPVEAELKVGEQKMQTGKNGLVLISPADREITVTAIDRQRHKIVEKISLNYNSDRDAFILKTGQSVINAGEELQLEIITNDNRYSSYNYYDDNDVSAGQVFIDFVKDKTSLLLLPVTLSKRRMNTQIRFKIPDDIFGTIQLHAYRILPQGKVERDMRLIQVAQNNPLTIKTQFSKPEYRPGETAKVNFAVKDQNGKPVPAALSIAAVDEMIFALKPENVVSERAYFLLQEELLKIDYQNQAAAILMSDKTSTPLSAGFLLENKSNINNLRMQCCDQYTARETRLTNRKTALDNDLFVCFIVLLLVSLLFINIPLLLVSLNAGREAYWMVVEKSCWKDIQRELRRVQLLLAAPVIIALFLIPFISICSTSTYASIMKYKLSFVVIALLFAGFMFLLTVFFKSRNRIFQYLSTDKIPVVQKVLLLIPWIYAVFIFIFFCFLFYMIFYSNTVGAGYLSVLFIILLLFPAVSINRIRYAICVKEDFELRSQSNMSLGFGIGKRHRGYSFIWIITCLSYAGPFVITYTIFVLTIIAMFMPFCRTIDKLGGGSGGGGGYDYPAAANSFVEPDEKQKIQFLNLNGEQLRKDDLPYIRRFFPETLYWQPQLITDEQGNASISFNVADTITNYRFNASAISRSGKLGAIQQELKVFQDFFVDFNPPENVISGDIISIPVVLYNYMKEPQQLSVTVQADKAFSIITPVYPVTLAPRSVTKSYLKVKFEHAAETKMLLTAIGKNCKDAIEKTVNIVPNGKKETVIISDVLQNSAQYKFKIPDNALSEGRNFFMKIYPTPLPQLADTLKEMLREPYGCFEQTTSITYPNIFIFKYLESTKQWMADRKKQTLEYINLGYQRLLTFESSGGGFSWYGNRQADIRLSAYGLMLLCDMETVMPIDRKVTERTAKWLEKQQNANGSWTQIRAKSSNLAITAFITMALNKTGYSEYPASKAGQYIIKQSRDCQDPYTLALCANALLKINKEQAVTILKRLHEMRKENNEQCTWWKPSSEGIFYSCEVETTALIADAMLSTGQYPATVKRAVIWLYRQGLNRYYSGHTLVQIMRTLINYDLACPQTKADTPFNLSASLNGTNQAVIINNKSINLLQYLPFKQALQDGENIMTVSGDISAMMGFQGVATYYLPNPVKTQKNASKSTLDLSVAYSKNSLQTGDITTCKIYLKNKGRSSAPMGIITMPVPPGFEIVSGPLEEMVRKAIIDKFEIGSDKLILYFREFGAGNQLLLNIDLKAIYPVEITAPALTAYPYYNPDNTAFSIPEKLTVSQANTGVE